MTKLQKMKTGLLASVAAGGLILSASTVQASAILFAPGDVTGANEASGFSGPDPDVPTGTNILTWRALNNSLASEFWQIVIKDDNTFSETFTFKLVSSSAGAYGTNAIDNATHVTMIADLHGTVNDHDAATENLKFTYSGPADTFKMFYHDDGVADDAGIEMAVFDLDHGTGAPVDNQTPDRWALSWNATASSVTNDALTDVGGVPLHLSQTQLKITNQEIRLPTTGQFSEEENLGILGDTNPNEGDGDRILKIGFVTAGTTIFQNVPEPGTLALFGVGLIGLGAASRRRKTKIAS